MYTFIQKFYLAWTTVALIVGLALVVSTAGVALYKTYTTDKQIQQATQLCTDVGGYITFSTNTGYSGTLKATKDEVSLVPNYSDATTLSCSPKDSPSLTTPSGDTLL